MGRLLGRLLASLALILVCFSTALGQTTFGSVTGTVSDPSGAVIPEAKVTLTNLGTGSKMAATTSANGIYQFVNILPGDYRLDVEKTGFKHLTRSPVTVQVQQSYRYDLAMQMGNVTQVIEVSGGAETLETQTSSLGHVIAGTSVSEMPLNGRNVFNLMTLVPSVVPQGESGGTPVGENPFGWNNYQVSGVLAGLSAETLDGVPMNSSYVNMPGFIPTQDSIQEFKVQTNNLGPEWGRYAGGVMNLVTKSGTNLIHGAAYEYLRNKDLNANNFFSNKAGLPVGAFSQNQFGANAGGPVYLPGVYDGRNKMFWFASYEGFYLRQGQTYTDTVPTAADLQGNFSNLLDSHGNVVPIYDPLSVCSQLGNAPCATTLANGTPNYLRTQFPGNSIPTNEMNITSVALEHIWPAPVTSGAQYTNLNNWTGLAAVGGDTDQIVTRIDKNVSDKQRIYARFSYSHLLNMASDPYKDGMCLAGECTEKYGSKSVALDDSYSFSPTMLLDVHLGYNRLFYHRIPVESGFDVTTIGWPAFMNNVQAPQYRTYPAPYVENESSALFSSQGMGDTIIARTNDWYNIVDLTKIHGRHTLKFGGNLYIQQENLGDIRLATGQYGFDHLFTQQGPYTNVGGFGFASYLLGYPSAGSQSEAGLSAAEEIYRALYLGDTWQATKKLTLNLGLRYEQDGPWTVRNNALAVWQLNVPSPLAAASGIPGLMGTTCLVDSSCRASRSNDDLPLRQFAPRVGFAYLLTKNTVVRGGYGISYIRQDFDNTTQPYASPLIRTGTSMIATINGGITPYNVAGQSGAPANVAGVPQNAWGWTNPFPTFVNMVPNRTNTAAYFLNAGGATISDPPTSRAYVQQWNIDIQRTFKGVLVDMAYAATKGTHLYGQQAYNQLQDKYLSMGSALNNQIPNPFYGLIATGPMSLKTISVSQSLRQYPQYSSVGLGDSGYADTIYNSFQLKIQKQLRLGMILASYTNSKFTGDVDEQNSWLEAGNGGVNGVIDWNNIKGSSYSLESADTPQRLVVSYVLNLPVGPGAKYLAGVHGVAGKLISGWGMEGISTFQRGFPLKIGNSGGGTRPNRTCKDASVPGNAESRLSGWFNTSCFSLSTPFTYGTESRVDYSLRQQGMNNLDVAFIKGTKISERVSLQFRGEFYNFFNTPEFGPPATTVGAGGFGVVNSQVNNPRLLQFGLKLLF